MAVEVMPVEKMIERVGDELGVTENTIVVYFSDNGPNTMRWTGGMKGKKGSTDEGGVHSVCYIRWPARLPAGNQHLGRRVLQELEVVDGDLVLVLACRQLEATSPHIRRLIQRLGLADPAVLDEPALLQRVLDDGELGRIGAALNRERQRIAVGIDGIA